MSRVRKGFTLVELLIVIVIIGILAAAMMLGSGSATAAAEATNIVSDLRNLQAAAMMLFGESFDEVADLIPLAPVASRTVEGIGLVAQFMDNPARFVGGSNQFGFHINPNTGMTHNSANSRWVVSRNTSDLTQDVLVRLQRRANSAGLFADYQDFSSTNTFAATGTVSGVWMPAR